MVRLMRKLIFLLLLTLSFTLTCASSRNDIFVGYSEAGCKDELESEICESYKASGMCTTGKIPDFRDTFLRCQYQVSTTSSWRASGERFA